MHRPLSELAVIKLPIVFWQIRQANSVETCLKQILHTLHSKVLASESDEVTTEHTEVLERLSMSNKLDSYFV